MFARLLLASCVLAGSLFSATSRAEAPDPKGIAFFETKIRPVLVEQCYRCHSADAKKLRGGLRLDTRVGLLKGGDTGPAIVPGKPEKSLLIASIRHQKLKMPPKSKLGDAIVADFDKWIAMGAPDPRTGAVAPPVKSIDFDEAKRFWSFRRFGDVRIPTVDDVKWVRTPIDRFIRAKQIEAGVTANAHADKRTLIRRAYFDLIGLPPTPEQVRAFLDDKSSDAYEKMVDGLLANKHYGERWARHWLDLARFAESNGYAFDKDRPNAYHYRDWVIKALTADMPYDEFVRRQIAGDLIGPNDIMTVAATGYLVAGPFTTQQTQKERERSRYEQLDDIVHTLGTSLLGLTVGCARCHTHKYDPIPQSDYYRFVAAFKEVGFADAGIDSDPTAHKKALADFEKVHAPLVAKLQQYEKASLPAALEKWLVANKSTPAPPKLSDWHHIGPFAGANLDDAFAKAFEPEKKVDLAKTYEPGKRKWKAQPAWKDGAVHNTLTGNNSANYLYRTIEVDEPQSLALSLGSDDAIKLWLNGREVLAKKVSRGAAADQEKATLQLIKGKNELLMKIVNGGGPSGFYFKTKADILPADVAKLLAKPAKSWNAKERQRVQDWFKPRDAGWSKRNAEVQAHLAKKPKPRVTKIYSAKNRGTTYNFGGNTYKVFHLRRGNPDSKEKEAQPGVLQVLLTGESPMSDKPARLALADWLTDVDNGAGHLLARVIVNRLWHHHFGRGIVATPSDFGIRGEAPTHPELLDWLAQELIRNGWKLKPIHKLIMTSGVYMQEGKPTETGKRNDPNNLLWWRKPARRLEAEILRDALLSVSGSLDLTPFGKGSLDTKSPRRSVYLTVKRSQLIPWMQLFDAPDTMSGIGRRPESTVAPQALALMNSPMVRDLAGKFAKRVRPKPDVPLAKAVEDGYKLAFGRSPRESERSRMLAFVDQQKLAHGGNAQAESIAVQDFCQLLLCTNEFLYID